MKLAQHHCDLPASQYPCGLQGSVFLSGVFRVQKFVTQQVLSPIALFVFKRATHTQCTLESLAKNTEFLQSQHYTFCYGARRESEVVEAVPETW